MGLKGSASKWGRKPTRDRGEVVWKDNSGAKPAPFVQCVPRYEETKQIPGDYEPFFVVGAMWYTTVPLNPNIRNGGEFPHVVPVWRGGKSAVIKAKSFMIYAGIARIEEREKNGRIVSVPRHTFIAGDGRYIVTDFTYIKPVE